MSNLLNFLEQLGITARRSSVAHGGEYHSLCPACGDGGKGKASDRFHIWPDKPNKNGFCIGRFWCRQCGVSGDTIQFLVQFHNMDFPSACGHLGLKLDGNSSTGYRLPTTPAPPKADVFEPREYPWPSQTWIVKATAFLADCHKRLLERPDALKWLADRGISLETVIEFQLGYNQSSKDGDRYRPRSLWGLPEKKGKDGKPKKLWLPRGWVIPAFSRDGFLYQLRIRRLDEDIARFASDIKYLRIEGSSDHTMVIYPGAKAHAVIECGFDAILLASLFDGRLGAITTWNSAARPDVHAHSILSQSPCILNALDSDAAGIKEQDWWNATYRQNKRWPVPVGKDPGDAYAAGVDLRRWVLAGLPSGLSGLIGGEDVEKSRIPAAPKHGEVKEKADSEPSTFASDTDELKHLLAEANGFFSVYGRGQGVGPRINPEWSAANAKKRARISELLYPSDEIDKLIGRLDDGVYNHMTLPV